MAKHFISILGTGSYQKSIYCCDGGSCETVFIQEAILKLKFREWDEQDRITVFVTEESRRANWLDRPYNIREKSEAEKNNCVLPEYRMGLESILKKDFDKYLDCGADNVIPLGANEEELWEIFDKIFSVLREGDELYVDITHALRNIPIQMLAVVAYARALKQVQIKAIYYGAFEVGKDNQDGIKEAPIFDLITFLNVLDWSQAAQAFVRYGNSEQIKELFQVKEAQSNVRLRELHKVVGEIDNVTRGLEASRGFYDNKPENKRNNKGGKSILESYYQYKESYDIMMKKDAKEKDKEKQQLNSIKPLRGLMELVDDKLSVFDVNSNLELGLAAIQWSIENNKIQQGFTALEETIKTFLCNFYGLDETEEKYRDGMCKSACSLLARELREGKELTTEVREEAYAGWDGQKATEEEMQIVRRIFVELPLELIQLTMNISNNRNSLNHFGYSNKGQFSSSTLEKNLKDYYAQFVDCMETMKEECMI